MEKKSIYLAIILVLVSPFSWFWNRDFFMEKMLAEKFWQREIIRERKGNRMVEISIGNVLPSFARRNLFNLWKNKEN